MIAVSLPATSRSLIDGVVLHGAVAVEMIGRQIEQDAGGRIDRRRQVDLVGRALDHVEALGRRRIERHDGAADIAAHLRVAAGRLDDVGGQRRRRRFAVGAGDGDERRARGAARALAREQLDVADDLDAGAARQLDRPVRLRDASAARRATAPGDEKPLQSALVQIADCDALLLGLGDAVRIVVPGKHLGAAFDQRVRGRQPGAAEPEKRDLLAVERCGRDHRLLIAA